MDVRFYCDFATFYAFIYRSEETWTIQSFTSCVLSFSKKPKPSMLYQAKVIKQIPQSNHFYKFIFQSQNKKQKSFKNERQAILRKR